MSAKKATDISKYSYCFYNSCFSAHYGPTTASSPANSNASTASTSIRFKTSRTNRDRLPNCCTKAASKNASAAAATAKAKKTAQAVKNSKSSATRKIRTRVQFYRPKTLKLDRKPKYERKVIKTQKKLDCYDIIKRPVTTESAMKMVETLNTIVFFVNEKANKTQIKYAINKLYDVKVSHVNTVNTFGRGKKAFVKLSPDVEAVDVASRIGII
ncbi:60S ribosomal protein L23a [Cryptosporidium felis]|nr:60S ribosomal protein L23a [Cryptosporidium felis]